MKVHAILTALVVLTLGTATSAAPAVTVTHVWSRAAIGTGVVYATLRDSGPQPDALVSASSPVANAVQLHETVTVAGKGPASGMSGMPHMAMHPVRAIPVPAHGSVELHPGGYHIMLIGLHHALEPGQTFPVTLRFRTAGTVHVTSHVVAGP